VIELDQPVLKSVARSSLKKMKGRCGADADESKDEHNPKAHAAFENAITVKRDFGGSLDHSKSSGDSVS
jgi:hypothetical protein